MGKYTDMPRNDRDYYPTPSKAVEPLISHLNGVTHYIEPFAGNGVLMLHLWELGDKDCCWAFDIEPQTSVFPQTIEQINLNDMADSVLYNNILSRGAQAVISNPPWVNTSDSNYQLTRFCNKLCGAGYPVILLLNANIINNKGFWNNRKFKKSLGDLCYQMLPIGRVKWIEGSPHSGKEDAAWFFFSASHDGSFVKTLPRT